jgi:hypothetical protein
VRFTEQYLVPQAGCEVRQELSELASIRLAIVVMLYDESQLEEPRNGLMAVMCARGAVSRATSWHLEPRAGCEARRDLSELLSSRLESVVI